MNGTRRFLDDKLSTGNPLREGWELRSHDLQNSQSAFFDHIWSHSLSVHCLSPPISFKVHYRCT